MIIYFFNLIIQIVISCSSVINIFLMRPQYLKNWSRLIKTPYLHLLNFNNRKHVTCCCFNHLSLTSDKFWTQWRSLLWFFCLFVFKLSRHGCVCHRKCSSTFIRLLPCCGTFRRWQQFSWREVGSGGGALGVLVTVLLTVDSSLPPSPAGCLRR